MVSHRLRVNPEHVFEVFCEVAFPSSLTEEPFILTKFPEDYSDQKTLKELPFFSCPAFPLTVDSVLHYSFVLTGEDGKWTFGFVRWGKSPPTTTCLVMLSWLPWHDSFFKTLNYIHELTNKERDAQLFVTRFLEGMYETPIPEVGLPITVSYVVSAKEHEFSTPCPDHHKLPSIPEDRNLTEYFNAVDTGNMIALFASLLNERRIVMTSKRLSRLSACIQSANSLLYPMCWQHIFIPVLPRHMLDYLSAPMPYLIGVPIQTMERVRKHEIGEVVILDLDENRLDSPFDDVHMLPVEVISFLRKNLRLNSNVLLGDAISRTFLKALVMLIGGYRDALTFPSGEMITFNRDIFVRSRPQPMKPFLERMLQLQIFQQFVDGRLAMLNGGQGFNDEFEFELNLHEDRSTNRLKTQYNEWLLEIKKEGSAIIKSVNPAMKSAYRQVRITGRQVKDKGKQAYREIRSKIQQKVNNSGQGSGMDRRQSRPRSAPSSPSGSPISRRRHANPTGGGQSTVSADPGLPSCSIKKSISGLIVETTDRTATYVRPTTTIQNGYNKRDAGTWDSSIWDEENKSLKQSDYQPPRINMDLLGELSEIFNQKCSSSNKDFGFGSTGFDPFSPTTTMPSNSFNPFYSNTVITSSGSSQQQQTATTTTGTTSSSTRRPSDLIKLESPPTEDLAAIFDPLAIRPVVNKSITQTLPPTTSSMKDQKHTFIDDFSISVPFFAPHPSTISSSTLTQAKSFTSSNGVISHSSNANGSTAMSRPKGLPLSLPPPPSSKSNFKSLIDKFEQSSVSCSNLSGHKFGQDSSMSSTTTSTTGTPISTLVSPSSNSNLKNPFEFDTFLPPTVTNSSISPVVTTTTTTSGNNWQQFE